MIDHLISNYLEVVPSVFSILLLLQLIKRTVKRYLTVPDLLWWFLAFALGGLTALLSPECDGKDLRCWFNLGLNNGGLAIVFYPLTKRIVKAIQDKILPGAK